MTNTSKIAVGVVSSDYSKGWISTVNGNGSKSNKVVEQIVSGTDMTSDPRVIAFSKNGLDRALVNSYKYAGVSALGKPGSALYGVYDPTAAASWGTPEALAQCKKDPDADIQNWSVSNPYGIVTVGTKMYVLDYDGAGVYEYDMADGYKQKQVVYTYTPPTGKTGCGTGLGYYKKGRDNYLIAVFGAYTNEEWVYTYDASILVKIKLGTTVTASTLSLNKNATSVTVEGQYAYISSSGGAQKAGGNGADSKLEVVDLETMSKKATIPATTAPSTAGDFVDVEFVNNKAYVLLANYNAAWSEYTYRVVQTTAADLQAGDFGANAKSVGKTVPANATWGLFPGGDTELYFVSGNKINMIDTTVNLSESAIDELASADGFEKGAQLNTASVVVKKTVTAATGRDAVATPVSCTKIARRIRRPEEKK